MEASPKTKQPPVLDLPRVGDNVGDNDGGVSEAMCEAMAFAFEEVGRIVECVTEGVKDKRARDKAQLEFSTAILTRLREGMRMDEHMNQQEVSELESLVSHRP